MNVFDFDGTIYDGDCGTDFHIYCMKKKPLLNRYFPFLVAGFLGYIFRIDKVRMKQHFFRFLRATDAEEMAERFWDDNIGKIADWYGDVRKEDDLIITASPEFLVRVACRRLGISNLIGTVMDPHSGRIEGKNCRDAEKIRRFREAYGDAQIDDFYSDSDLDLPLAKLSKRAFKVTGGKVVEWFFERD